MTDTLSPTTTFVARLIDEPTDAIDLRTLTEKVSTKSGASLVVHPEQGVTIGVLPETTQISIPATLRLPGRFGRHVAVAVELAPWSEGTAEVAIRTKRGIRLESAAIERYCAAADEVLTKVADTLTARTSVSHRRAPTSLAA